MFARCSHLSWGMSCSRSGPGPRACGGAPLEPPVNSAACRFAVSLLLHRPFRTLSCTFAAFASVLHFVARACPSEIGDFGEFRGLRGVERLFVRAPPSLVLSSSPPTATLACSVRRRVRIYHLSSMSLSARAATRHERVAALYTHNNSTTSLQEA